MSIGRVPGATGIQPSIVDAKGDLIVATAADSVDRLAVGTNEQRLVADSAVATGLKYVADTTNYAIAAKGDLLVGTAADTVSALTVGSANQVLTVDSSTATGLKWATPSSGALTKITDGSFSNQATVDVDNIFSTTYLTYMAIIQVSAVTADNDFEIQFRYAGPTTETAGYYTSAFQYDRGNTLTTAGVFNGSAARLLDGCGASGDPSYITVYFREVGNSSGDNPVYWGSGQSRLQSIANFAGYNDYQRLYTGIRLKSSSSNISGNYRIYGLAN